MPELTVYRTSTAPPPMVCMYCGAPATATQEWREENHKPMPNSGGGGADLSPVPAGDDLISAVIAILMLLFVLWQLLAGLVAAVAAVVGFINRPPSPPAQPVPALPRKRKDPPTTFVVVTTCDRHRRFRTRFVWPGAGMLLLLAALWVWAGLILRRDSGTDHTDLAVYLTLIALVAAFALPMALSLWYVLAGPVIVERVTEETVVLDRVRQAYFDATGLKASNVD